MCSVARHPLLVFAKTPLHFGKRYARPNRNGQIAGIVFFNLVQARGAHQNVDALRHAANLLFGQPACRRDHEPAFVRQLQHSAYFFR